MSGRATIPRVWDAQVLRNLPTTQRYLVGVSGGRDSVVLLHWLLAQGYRRLVVCHLDHQLRGRSARTDARFVGRLSEANSLPFELGATDVRQLAAARKLSTETAARMARYSFFAAVAKRRRCRTIFLGHQADDLVETFLINLFRGAGARGQRSMRAVSTRSIDKVELTVVRPLLGVWREEIDDYVRQHRVRFREDATNQKLDALRNRVRLRIIPTIERELAREIRKPIQRAALLAAEEDALLERMLPANLAQRSELRVEDIRALPVALQRRAIAKWLQTRAVADVGFEAVEQVRALLETRIGPAKVNLPGDRHARRRAGLLFIE